MCKFTKLLLIFILLTSVTLVGCFGSDDDNPAGPGTASSIGKWLLTGLTIDGTVVTFDPYFLVFEEDGTGRRLDANGSLTYTFNWSIDSSKVTFTYENRNPETKDFTVTETELTINTKYVMTEHTEHFVETFTRQAFNPAAISGKVTEVNTTNPVEGAAINSDDGESTVTDSNGNYTLSVEPGSRTISVSMDGYRETHLSIDVSSSDTKILDFVLVPVTGAGGVYSFVLTWGEKPANLDCNMHFTAIEGIQGTISHGGSGSADSRPYINIGDDDFNGYGPEAMTIYQVFPSTYTFFIYNRTQELPLANCGAVVRIFHEDELLHTIRIPATGEGPYWMVCQFYGINGEFNITNEIVVLP